MCTDTLERSVIKDLRMVDGLSAREVDEHVGRSVRLQDIGRRVLAFYLCEVKERALHNDFGCSSTYHYARVKHGLSKRRTRELLVVGAKLLELTKIDAAFCAHDIGWSKVLLLLRVASVDHEEAWVEKAKEVGIDKLRREVTFAKEGGPPRKPGDKLGISQVRYPVRAEFDAALHEMFTLVQKKLAAERERSVPLKEVFATLFGIYLDLERDGEAPGWKHVPSSLYRIHLRPLDHGDNAPLIVETDDGPMPLDVAEADDVVIRQRAACACCDGEHIDDECVAEGGGRIDVPTPTAMRRKVLDRDRGKCRCCGERHSLQVHHIAWRSQGGRTKVWNLITLCMRCHALVHDGLLVIKGTTQKKARFFDREGHPILGSHGKVDRARLVRIDPPPGRSLDVRTQNPEPERATLDQVPEVVDGDWWRRHAQLIRCRADGSLEYKPGTPADEAPPRKEPRAQLSFDDAFHGIVGLNRLRERLRHAAVGAMELEKAFPHSLFYGPPGTGKTTLAAAVAAATGAQLSRTNGPLVQDTASLLRLLAALGERDVLFIDEVHAVPQAVLEVLYQAMAEGRLSLTLHDGVRERCVTLDLPAFTVLAATTEQARLPWPLVTRFPLRECLALYEKEDLARLAIAAAVGTGCGITEEAAVTLAAYARGTPRTLLHLLEHAALYAASLHGRQIDSSIVAGLLGQLGYDGSGLSPLERRCLDLLRRSPGPISSVRLARALGVDEGTLHSEVESELLARGLMQIGPGGRSVARDDTRHSRPSVGRRNFAAVPHGASLARDRRRVAI